MTDLSLASIKADVEALAGGLLDHLKHSINLKGDVAALEKDLMGEVESAEARIMDRVGSMLDAFRSEIVGKVDPTSSGNVEAVTKALADLSAPAEPEPKTNPAPEDAKPESEPAPEEPAATEPAPAPAKAEPEASVSEPAPAIPATPEAPVVEPVIAEPAPAAPVAPASSIAGL